MNNTVQTKKTLSSYIDLVAEVTKIRNKLKDKEIDLQASLGMLKKAKLSLSNSVNDF